MRRLMLLIVGLALGLASIGCAASRADEPGALTASARTVLIALRGEDKFRPGLLYSGPDLPEDGPALNAAVNGVIDAVLARPDGPLVAADILPLMKEGMQALDLFATEDRERGYRQLDRIWRALGLSGNWLRTADDLPLSNR